MVKNWSKQRMSKNDKVFQWFNYICLSFLLLVIMYPLYFIVIASVSDPKSIYNGEVIFKIKDFTFSGYSAIFNTRDIWIGYRNSLFYMFVGTFISLVLTLPAAYAFSRKDLVGRSWLTGIFLFTMFFSGGIIPTYMLIRSLNMLDTIWIMILGFNVYNMIVARAFFQSTIPVELLEAARIDGSGNTQFFFRVVLPISPALIAVLTLYYGVANWNSFFNALIYLTNRELFPLQLFLREILLTTQKAAQMGQNQSQVAQDMISTQQMLAESIKYGSIIVASLPMLILYPFVQKYFIRGVLIGSLKG